MIISPLLKAAIASFTEEATEALTGSTLGFGLDCGAGAGLGSGLGCGIGAGAGLGSGLDRVEDTGADFGSVFGCDSEAVPKGLDSGAFGALRALKAFSSELSASASLFISETSIGLGAGAGLGTVSEAGFAAGAGDISVLADCAADTAEPASFVGLRNTSIACFIEERLSFEV